MNRSDEWQLQLWPLKLEIGIRSRTLDEAMPGPEAVPPRQIARAALATDTSRGVVRAPGLEELLIWESEGGNLG